MAIDPQNRGHPFLIPGLVVAILLAGCASGGSGEDAFEDVPVWRLEEVLRIGDVVDPDLGFSRVASIAVAGDGRIFVLDSQERQVRVFSPEGERLGTIGRQGSGPGEFESPSGLGVLGDTVWVEDFDTRGVTLFSTDGNLLKSVIGPTNALEVGNPPRTVLVRLSNPYPDGTFESSYSYMIGPDVSYDDVRIPRLRFHADGVTADTVGWFTASFAMPVSVSIGGRTTFLSQQIADSPLKLGSEGHRKIVDRRAAPSPDAGLLAVISTGEDEADTLSVRTLPYRPVAVDAAFADSVRGAAIERLVGQGYEEADVRRAVRRHMDLPRYLPPVTRALLGEDGTLWLRREQDRADHWRWHVLDPDAEPIGGVYTPRSFDIRLAEADRIWGVDTDEFDIPWVVSYRIIRDETE